jgi:DNA-binding transcriptional regulator GbsR (MarR family)
LEENSKKEILDNLEKLHDMVQDNDPNDQDQAVSEIMEEKVSDLYNELQENKFDIEAANMSMIDKAEVESKLDTTFVNELVQIVTNEDETITGNSFLLCHK